MLPEKRIYKEAFLSLVLQVFMCRFDHLTAKTAAAFLLLIVLIDI